MSFWGIHISNEVNLGDILVGIVPTLAILINVLVLRAYRNKPTVELTGGDIKLIKNERAKLSASWANTIATGLLAAGFFPAITTIIKVAEGNGQTDWPFVLTGLTLTPFAFLLHLIGRFLLRARLKTL